MKLSAYNPATLSRDDLVRGFVARGTQLTALLEELRRPNPQHCLLVGQRGMGKTTLLRRVYYAALEEDAITKRWLPLAFREEQYNVASLSDFWLNCLDALAATLRDQSKHDSAYMVELLIDPLRTLPPKKTARAALLALEEQS